MKHDILTREERLLFLQSKHDRTDGYFLVVLFCLAVIEGIAQLMKFLGNQ